MTPRAMLFDFDGTLADSFGAITASTNHVRERYALPPLEEITVREYVGLGLENLLSRLAPGVDPHAAVALYREHHPTVMFTHTRLFPGVPETLRALKARGLKLAVCSNKAVHFTKQLVNGLHLAEFFPVVLGPEDVAKPKPDPAMLVEACRRLEVSINESIYIGDMAIDVHTARAAGMPVWIMPGGAKGDEDAAKANPDHMLRDFAEIRELVQ